MLNVEMNATITTVKDIDWKFIAGDLIAIILSCVG